MKYDIIEKVQIFKGLKKYILHNVSWALTRQYFCGGGDIIISLGPWDHAY